MEKSIINNFTNYFNNWFQNEALPQLVDYLKNHKNLDITVDELKSFLELPSPNTPVMGLSTVMGLPDNTVIVPTNSTEIKTNKGRKKNTVESLDPCNYGFIKGKAEKEGKKCGKPSIAYGYCIQCITKMTAISELEKRGVNKELIHAIRANHNNKAKLREILTNINSETISKPTINSTVLSGPNFTEVPGHKGFYIMEDKLPGALFIKMNSNDPYVCHGKMDLESKEGPFPLTKEEVDLIKSLGYAYTPPKSESKIEEPSPEITSTTIIPQAVIPPSLPQVNIPVSMPPIVKDTLYPISNLKI